jgi:hypothetical protein
MDEIAGEGTREGAASLWGLGSRECDAQVGGRDRPGRCVELNDINGSFCHPQPAPMGED